MTAPTQTRRPSPYPRPVTERDSEIGNAESGDAPPERDDIPERTESLHSAPKSAITDGDTWRRWYAAARRHYTPPSVLTDRPASVAALRRYAYSGAWTKRTIGPVRSAGIAWFRVIGLPKTVWNRYSEWVWQRPGRAIPVLLLIKLLASTTPGVWVVDHIVKPGVAVGFWIFL